MSAIKGKTKTGFEFEVEKESANDYELLEILGELEEKPVTVTVAVKQLLGDEQTNKLKDHVRNEKGRVPTDKMTKEVMDIFEAMGEEGKNS